MSAPRLRLALLCFFCALAAPAALLAWRAWNDVRRDALEQYRTQAEAFARHVDDDLARTIAQESARPSTDYGFLRVVGDRAVYAERSPLSELAPADAPAGLLGYFELDGSGRYRSPLLPAAGVDIAAYGVSDAELAERRARSAAIAAILDGGAGPAAPRPTLAGGAPDQATSRIAPRPPDQVRNAYERLSEAERAPRSSRDSLAESTLFDAAPAATGALPAPATAGAVARRKEQVALYAPASAIATTPMPLPAPAAAPAATAAATPALAERVPSAPPGKLRRPRIFESELGPLGYADLDGRHGVLFRNVWRDGERLIQGLLLERDAWLGAALRRSEAALGAPAATRITLDHEGVRLLDTGTAGSAEATVLHRHRLAAPLAAFTLDFSAAAPPPGARAAYLGWVTGAFLLVLGGGCLVIYRHALGQLALLRQQQDFVAAVSHELRTPLTSIRMYSEMLQAGWAEEARKADYYGFIHSESERLSRIIDNVLALARMTRGQYRPVLQTQTLATALARCLPQLVELTTRAGFTLTRHIDPAAEHATLALDDDAFTQILINLVDNAIKFTPADAPKHLVLSAAPPAAGQLHLHLRDHGRGFAQSDLPRLFERFWRADSARSAGVPGTGIGLALVQQMMTAMSGSVTARACEPGAEFTLSLPVVATTD